MRTNERVLVCEHVGVLLCCDGVCGYTHTHISFDLGCFGVGGVLYHTRQGVHAHPQNRYMLVEN